MVPTDLCGAHSRTSQLVFKGVEQVDGECQVSSPLNVTPSGGLPDHVHRPEVGLRCGAAPTRASHSPVLWGAFGCSLPPFFLLESQPYFRSFGKKFLNQNGFDFPSSPRSSLEAGFASQLWAVSRQLPAVSSLRVCLGCQELPHPRSCPPQSSSHLVAL